MADVLLPELRAPLLAAIKVLDQLAIPHIVIGGVAVAIWGQPRFTADVDFLAIPSTDDLLHELIHKAEHAGLVPRLTDAEQFARENRVLLLQHESTKVNVDITLGFLPFEHDMVDRAIIKKIADTLIKLPRIDDLVVMKAVAHRQQDLQDIRALLQIHKLNNLEHAKQMIRQFAEALENQEIFADAEKLLDGQTLTI